LLPAQDCACLSPTTKAQRSALLHRARLRLTRMQHHDHRPTLMVGRQWAWLDNLWLSSHYHKTKPNHQPKATALGPSEAVLHQLLPNPETPHQCQKPPNLGVDFSMPGAQKPRRRLLVCQKWPIFDHFWHPKNHLFAQILFKIRADACIR